MFAGSSHRTSLLPGTKSQVLTLLKASRLANSVPAFSNFFATNFSNSFASFADARVCCTRYSIPRSPVMTPKSYASACFICSLIQTCMRSKQLGCPGGCLRQLVDFESASYRRKCEDRLSARSLLAHRRLRRRNLRSIEISRHAQLFSWEG